MRQGYSFRCIPVNPLRCLTNKYIAPNLMRMTLGERLRIAREDHAGLTQKQLEEKSGVPQQMISKIENGYQKRCSYIVELADACGVRPQWLQMGKGEMTEMPYSNNNKVQTIFTIAQTLPDYALDEAIKSVASIKELIEMAETNKTKTQ